MNLTTHTVQVVAAPHKKVAAVCQLPSRDLTQNS